MLVHLVRAGLLAEAALLVALGHGLARQAGWPVAAAVLAMLAAGPAIRLAIVGVSMSLAHRARSPREPSLQLGIAGTLVLVLGEWRAMLANNYFYLPLEPLALRDDPPCAPSASPPVLFVHGYFSNRGILRSLVRDLERRGAHPLHTFNFDGLLRPIEDLAGQLHDQVEALAAGTGAARVVLVCHSMGGLVARAYLARYGAGRVLRLVTIGSPHHGTALARLGLGENGRQMRVGSPFLSALEAKEGEAGPGCPATSIYSVHDNLVSPQATSRLAWARNRALSGVGHVALLLDPRVHDQVAAELREAGVAFRP